MTLLDVADHIARHDTSTDAYTVVNQTDPVSTFLRRLDVSRIGLLPVES